MRTYVFTYFKHNYSETRFRVNASRFEQAFDSFCTHLQVVSSDSGIVGYSSSYQVISESKSRYYFLPYKRQVALEAIKEKCHE